MTAEEIFTKVAEHMREGIMYHDALSKAFDFIGLYGFSRCHDYHCCEEMHGYRLWLHYYSTHFHRLLKVEIPNPQHLIPDTWYKYTTLDVDMNTRKNAVHDYMTKWVEWEQATKKLYQEMRQELSNTLEIAAALELDKYILDVSEELKHAEKKLIKLEAINYDMPTICEWQQHMYNKYNKKLGW